MLYAKLTFYTLLLYVINKRFVFLYESPIYLLLVSWKGPLLTCIIKNMFWQGSPG